ncbi:MAG: hypothetical protein B1H03_03905 [Planctomycetales bacterium 4484_113]|nr:MAG: hypothetical protein B1H03_03905 [Planctomycetales bacterium 4484_113]
MGVQNRSSHWHYITGRELFMRHRTETAAQSRRLLLCPDVSDAGDNSSLRRRWARQTGMNDFGRCGVGSLYLKQ